MDHGLQTTDHRPKNGEQSTETRDETIDPMAISEDWRRCPFREKTSL